jgi:hypothetical protein
MVKWQPHFNYPPWADADFEMPPWENRMGPLPWENCDREVAHLLERWGIGRVMESLRKVRTGRPAIKNKCLLSWKSVEIYRRVCGCGSVRDACNGLSKFLKRNPIPKFQGISTNPKTLERNYYAAQKELPAFLPIWVEAVLGFRFIVEDDDEDLKARISFV